MSFRPWMLASVIAGFSFVASSQASAERAPSQVTVVRTPDKDRLLREASTRLKAELAGAGFSVTEVERAPGPGDEPQGFATISINRTGQGALADVWISDHVTGKTVTRRLRVGAAPNAANVLAIRAMELLRASLLELTLPATEPEAPPSAPPDVLKWVEPVPKTLSKHELLDGTALTIGGLALHSFGGIGPAIGPQARISHGIAAGWFGRLSLAAPLQGQTLSEPAGSATVTQQFASVDLGWAMKPRPFAAFAWAGLGAFYLHTTGTAAEPYHSTSDGVLSFLAAGGVGGLARLGARLAITAELAALGLVPKPVVIIADKHAGSAGAPSLGASIGLLVGL
jgi:hypothetical protein